MNKNISPPFKDWAFKMFSFFPSKPFASESRQSTNYCVVHQLHTTYIQQPVDQVRLLQWHGFWCHLSWCEYFRNWWCPGIFLHDHLYGLQGMVWENIQWGRKFVNAACASVNYEADYLFFWFLLLLFLYQIYCLLLLLLLFLYQKLNYCWIV